jgi:hypothetical protein
MKSMKAFTVGIKEIIVRERERERVGGEQLFRNKFS